MIVLTWGISEAVSLGGNTQEIGDRQVGGSIKFIARLCFGRIKPTGSVDDNAGVGKTDVFWIFFLKFKIGCG